MEPEKLIRATSHGMATLSKRIGVLRNQIEPMLQGYLQLHNMKHEAQLEVIPVQMIPTGVSAAKHKATLKKNLNDLSDAQAVEAFELLKQKLGL